MGLEGDVDGMVHLSDLDWQKPGEQALEEYNRGDMVKAKVLDVDVEKERISLGIKQLGTGDEKDSSGEGLKKGSVVTTVVTEVNDGGIEVKIEGSEMTAFIRRAGEGQTAEPEVDEREKLWRQLLPPQAALLRLEEAFGALQPIPWDAFLYIAAYSLVLLLLAGIALARREV